MQATFAGEVAAVLVVCGGMLRTAGVVGAHGGEPVISIGAGGRVETRSMQVHPPHLTITRLASHHGLSWSSTRPFILFLTPPHHLGMFARSSLVRPALQAARIGAAAPAMRLAPASSRSVHRVPTTAGAAGTPPASSPVWKLGRLNHVAIAVPDLDKGISFYRDVLGGNCSDTVVGRPTPAYHTSHCVQPHSCAPAQTNPPPRLSPTMACTRCLWT